MNGFKYTLAASASALLMPIGVGTAADLPSRKSAPIEYVRVCDTYGAGFYWIPGTDTCLKVGGRVRVDMWYTPGRNTFTHRSATGGVGANNFVRAEAIDQNGVWARGIAMMDARTQSAWGTVQTVITLRLGAHSGLGNGNGNIFGGNNNAGASVEAAYVRFAGFTAGQAASNFTFLPPFQYHALFLSGFPVGIRQLAYTATFAGGFSATLALENRAELTNSMAINTLTGPFFGATPTLSGSPQRLPALVGNLRVDQPWGAAMISAAVLENVATGALGTVGTTARRTGWAISGGLRINLPMLAAGDSIQGWMSYGVGALDYVINSGIHSNPPVSSLWTGGFLRADRNVTAFCANATCTAIGTEMTKAMSIGGIFTHYWTPSLRSHLIGTYARVTPGAASQATPYMSGGLGNATAWNVLGSLIWSPVRNFDIGLELSYARLSQNVNRVGMTIANGGLLIPASSSNWTGRMRVERTF